MANIKLFEQNQIHSVWNEAEQKRYFVVEDVVAALTDSNDPKQYLKRMKQRDPELAKAEPFKRWPSKVGWSQPCVFGDTGKHSRAYFLSIMETENIIGPTGPGENLVGACSFALDGPTDAKQCGKDTARFLRGAIACPPTRQGSCSEKGDRQRHRGDLAQIYSLGEDTQCEGLGLKHCLFPALPVHKDPGNIDDLSDPPPVLVLFEFDTEVHGIKIRKE